MSEIIARFRSGEKDDAEFWISNEGMFIYIKYVAVRDARVHFRGVLGMMQECSHIRSLEGSRPLLSWDNEKTAEPKAKPQGETPVPGQCSTQEREKGEEDSLNPATMLKDLIAQYPRLKGGGRRSTPSSKCSVPLWPR